MPEPDLQIALLPEMAPLKVASEAFCTFEVAGEPRAWGRPGASIRWAHGHPFIHWFVRAPEARWREHIAWVARSAMRGRKPASGPLAAIMHAFVGIPPSWHWLTRQRARNGTLLPTGKPDADNFLKLMDALKGIVFVDDAQVIDARCIKRYSDKPALRIEVREMLSPI